MISSCAQREVKNSSFSDNIVNKRPIQFYEMDRRLKVVKSMKPKQTNTNLAEKLELPSQIANQHSYRKRLKHHMHNSYVPTKNIKGKYSRSPKTKTY